MLKEEEDEKFSLLTKVVDSSYIVCTKYESVRTDGKGNYMYEI